MPLSKQYPWTFDVGSWSQPGRILDRLKNSLATVQLVNMVPIRKPHTTFHRESDLAHGFSWPQQTTRSEQTATTMTVSFRRSIATKRLSPVGSPLKSALEAHMCPPDSSSSASERQDATLCASTIRPEDALGQSAPKQGAGTALTPVDGAQQLGYQDQLQRPPHLALCLCRREDSRW